MSLEEIFEMLADGFAVAVEKGGARFELADAGGVSGFEEWRGRRVLRETRQGTKISRFYWHLLTN
jgi:hypothetical protein